MEKRDVGYMFTLAYSMGEGASLTIAGNFKIGEDEATMNSELDKCYNVMDRQRAKVMIPVIEERIRVEEKQLENIQEQINNMTASIQESTASNKRPNDATANQLKTLEKNIEIGKYNIKTGRKQL